MLRSDVRLGSRAYLLESTRSIMLIDHWTLGGIAHSLEDCCLPCIGNGSSNNEDPEFEIAGESGEILLRVHGTKVYNYNLKTED
jgi:hypothetical protein